MRGVWQHVDMDRMLAMRAQGMTIKSIACALGISWPSVRRRLTLGNAPIKPRRPPIPICLERLARLRQQGKSTRKIAAILGCAPNTVRRRLLFHDMPRTTFRADVDTETLLRMHASGKSYGVMARALGVSHRTIERRLKILAAGESAKVDAGPHQASI